MVMKALAKTVRKASEQASNRKPAKKTKPFRSKVGRTSAMAIHSGVTKSPYAPAIHGGIVRSDFASAKQGPTIPAGKFKATCLQLLDRSAAGEVITITKHGKVVARLVPPEETKEKPFVPLLGRMKGKIKILGDIVSPDFEAWEES